ncbi:hypothetical protein ACFSHQ_21060 [Gemmobacter lanyuensis]
MEGRAGADTLNGGGNDSLTGGSGADLLLGARARTGRSMPGPRLFGSIWPWPGSGKIRLGRGATGSRGRTSVRWCRGRSSGRRPHGQYPVRRRRR